MVVYVAVVNLQMFAMRHWRVNVKISSAEVRIAVTQNWMFVKMSQQKKTFILASVIIEVVMKKVVVKILLSEYVVKDFHVNVFSH